MFVNVNVDLDLDLDLEIFIRWLVSLNSKRSL